MNSECICISLRHAAQSSTAFYDAALAPSGLKITMFRLLRRIGQSSGISITELARNVSLDRSTLSRNLRVLERQNYVRLSVAEDERARAVTLLPAGAEALAQALPLWTQAQNTLAQALGPQLDAFMASLDTLTTATDSNKDQPE